MSKPIPQIGTVVRFGVWNGIVLDVYGSTTSNKHIVQIMFAKNIYKRQPAELHILEDLAEGLLLPSKKDALKEELARYNSSALAEADQLLEKAVDQEPIPVEVEVHV